MYDSLFTSVSDETLQLIAQLMKTRNSSIDVNIMNVQKQAGAVDCGLYAVTTVTCLLLGHDPTSVVFNQKEIRLHLVKLLEANTFIIVFSSEKSPTSTKNHQNTESFVFCICRLPDNSEEMVSCDKCQEWFHLACCNITEAPNTEPWFCLNNYT